MSDNHEESKLHIDSDWKTEAAQEKERLARDEEKTTTPPGAADTGSVSITDLVNLIAMQAVIGLGGYNGPGGESLPPNPPAAKHHIDLLDVLSQKTAGNLTDDEKRTLDTVLYELRMQYVQAMTPPPAPAPAPEE